MSCLSIWVKKASVKYGLSDSMFLSVQQFCICTYRLLIFSCMALASKLGSVTARSPRGCRRESGVRCAPWGLPCALCGLPAPYCFFFFLFSETSNIRPNTTIAAITAKLIPISIPLTSLSSS